MPVPHHACPVPLCARRTRPACPPRPPRPSRPDEPRTDRPCAGVAPIALAYPRRPGAGASRLLRAMLLTVLVTVLVLASLPAPAGPLRDWIQARRQGASAPQPAPGAAPDAATDAATDAAPDADRAGPAGARAASARPARGPGRAALPGGVRLLPDQPYGPHRLQRMDVYLPPTRSGAAPAPVIVMAHGGGWRRGDKAMGGVVDDKVARWVARGDGGGKEGGKEGGAVLVSINYRTLPDASPLQQAQDVARAIAAVQQRAPGWGADPRRVVLMGHSAGAHLMALVASSAAVRARAGAPIQPWLGTVLLDSATLDVPMTMHARHMRLYDDAFGADPATWAAVSPWHQLDGPTPPVLIVCSSRRKEACAQARHYAGKVQSLGGRASVLPRDLRHGEINEKLGEPGAYTDAVEAFLKHIGAR